MHIGECEMKINYKGVLCELSIYRVMGEDRPALYPADGQDFQAEINAGFTEVHYGLWAKVLTDKEYREIVDELEKNG